MEGVLLSTQGGQWLRRDFRPQVAAQNRNELSASMTLIEGWASSCWVIELCFTGIKKPACGRIFIFIKLMIYNDLFLDFCFVPPFIPPLARGVSSGYPSGLRLQSGCSRFSSWAEWRALKSLLIYLLCKSLGRVAATSMSDERVL